MRILYIFASAKTRESKTEISVNDMPTQTVGLCSLTGVSEATLFSPLSSAPCPALSHEYASQSTALAADTSNTDSQRGRILPQRQYMCARVTYQVRTQSAQ